jgi:hypothetical protein
LFARCSNFLLLHGKRCGAAIDVFLYNSIPAGDGTQTIGKYSDYRHIGYQVQQYDHNIEDRFHAEKQRQRAEIFH